MSRKRKASLRARATEMNEARAERKQLEMSEEVRDEQTAGTSGDSGETSLLDDLPGPVDQWNSSDEGSGEEDDDFECTITEDEISAIYSDWISELQ